MIKKKILSLTFFWLPLAAITTAPTTTSKTLPAKKPAFNNPKSVKITPQKPKPHPTPAPVAALALAATPSVQDLPLITVFNTLAPQEDRSIVIKANCLLKNGILESRVTKILGTPTHPEGITIAPLSAEVLQVPAGAIELWAEEKNTFNIILKTNPIPFSIQQEASAVVVSRVDGKPDLQTISLLEENILVFYNQTSVPQTLTFLKNSTFVGFTFNSKQLSFNLPAYKIVSLPAPQNAASFTIGNTNLSPIPTSKTVFLLTAQTNQILGSPNPAITQLRINS